MANILCTCAAHEFKTTYIHCMTTSITDETTMSARNALVKYLEKRLSEFLVYRHADTHFQNSIWEKCSDLRVILNFVFTFLLIIAASDLKAGSYDESVARIRDDKASVIDYFLTCHICSDEFGGQGRKGFDSRDLLIRATRESQNKSQAKTDAPNVEALLLDTKNGFASFSHHSIDIEGSSHILTMALFVSRNKTKTVGVSEFYSGLDSDIYQYHFYRVESEHWYDVTKDVFESIPFDDFAKNEYTRHVLHNVVDWEVSLPRFGTTALLQPHIVYGLPMDEYQKLEISGGAMELQWDPGRGKFIKGNMVDPAHWNAHKGHDTATHK